VTKELFDHPLLFGLFSGTYRPEQLQPMYRTRIGRSLGITPSSDEKLIRLDFRTNLPSYIPSRNFALALLDLVAGSGSKTDVFEIEHGALPGSATYIGWSAL
jgi:hypothetical protein